MAPNEASAHVVDGAIKVHSALGPGLLESAYRAFLTRELFCRGLRVRNEVPVTASYRGLVVDLAYRIDLLVEECLVVELKAISNLLPVHEAQILSQLKLSGHRLGLLINFHVPHLKHGIRRFVNGL